MQFTSFDVALSVFGRVKMSLSLAMRVVRGEHLHVYTFLAPKSTIFHAACVAARYRAESFEFLDTNDMGKIGNVLGSWRIVWYTVIPSRFTTFQCR